MLTIRAIASICWMLVLNFFLLAFFYKHKGVTTIPALEVAITTIIIVFIDAIILKVFGLF